MRDWQTVAHVRWECKYHIVWVPKYRRKALYGSLRRRFGQILKELCRQRGIELLERHAMVDHLHVCLSFPPRYSIANVVGFLKGKSAIRLHREFIDNKTGGKHFCFRGYHVSTVGLDEKKVREYIRNQEKLDKDPMDLDFE